MKNKYFFVVAVLMATFLWGQALAFALPATVRVGLESKFKGVQSISVGNQALWVGYGSQNAALVYASAGFTIAPGGDSYGVTDRYFNSYEEATAYVAQLSQEGRRGVPAFLAVGSWTVYTPGVGSAAAGNPKRVVLMDGGVEAVVFDNSGANPQISGNGEAVSLGSNKYRGTIELMRSGGALTAINVISVEEYLYSVTASEMPSKWHIEALKAQSVAARSYTYTRLGIHNDSGYELCDLVHCQAYNGVGGEAETSIQAVMETSGVVAYHNGAPINAVYCSSAGGATDNSENVWTETVPYLRGKTELFEDEGKRWVRSFAPSELDSLLATKGYNIGKAVGVSIGGYSDTGRVTELIIRGTNGSKSLYKEEIRTFFSGSKDGNLESKFFTIGSGETAFTEANVSVMGADGQINQFLVSKLVAITNDLVQKALERSISVVGAELSANYSAVAGMTAGASSGSGNQIVLTGRGWGHGVGMSQYGAKAMAENGYTYKQILEFYYTGIEVK